MSARRSLRSRLVIGALLWSLGLSAVVTLTANVMVLHYRHSGRSVHFVVLAVIALGLILAGLSQVRRGLSPFVQLRERLGEVRRGRTRRLEGAYPAEVQPLVDDLNGLLDDREQRVTRAMARAGDLAHGLKTPLAVLAQEADRARALGQDDLAATIAQQVARMRRQVEHHLAQSRASAAGGTAVARCPLSDSAEGLARTLRRLYADRGLAIAVDESTNVAVRVQREDLDEMLGNLLDNACKWARTRVAVAATSTDAIVVVTVDDDGPGIAPAMREAVLQRGVRADEAAPGSGFGLAIVRELAEIYGGLIALDASPAGGARARLQLPRA